MHYAWEAPRELPGGCATYRSDAPYLCKRVAGAATGLPVRGCPLARSPDLEHLECSQ